MNREEFFNRLCNMVKDSDIDWEENFVGDEEEGELYIKFTNIKGDENDIIQVK